MSQVQDLFFGKIMSSTQLSKSMKQFMQALYLVTATVTPAGSSSIFDNQSIKQLLSYEADIFNQIQLTNSPPAFQQSVFEQLNQLEKIILNTVTTTASGIATSIITITSKKITSNETTTPFTYVTTDTLATGSDLATYNNLVKQNIKKILPNDVFTFYTTNIQDLEANPLIDITYNKSFYDIIIDFFYKNRGNALLDSDGVVFIDSSVLSTEGIYMNSFFEATIDLVQRDDFNEYILLIKNSQTEIASIKDEIRDSREKLYTLISHDTNFNKNLKNKRMYFYLYLISLIVVSAIYALAFSSLIQSIEIKNGTVVSVAATILFIHALTIILPMMKSRKLVISIRETFANPPLSTYTHLLTAGAAHSIDNLLTKFVTTYDKHMTFDVKNKYYESLTKTQSADKKILTQINDEKNVKEEFYKLKNNLTIFKTNELGEYCKLLVYATIIISFIALLYLATINLLLPIASFKLVAILSMVSFSIYVLLITKSIMARDKYDWDRIHWNLTAIKGDLNQGNGCNLPGR
jgi:hypothetical protein